MALPGPSLATAAPPLDVHAPALFVVRRHPRDGGPRRARNPRAARRRPTPEPARHRCRPGREARQGRGRAHPDAAGRHRLAARDRAQIWPAAPLAPARPGLSRDAGWRCRRSAGCLGGLASGLAENGENPITACSIRRATAGSQKKSLAARLAPTLPLSWTQNSAAVSVSVLPWTMVFVPEVNQERSPGVVPRALWPSQWKAWSPACALSGSIRERLILSWPWTKSVITSLPLVAGLFWALT